MKKLLLMLIDALSSRLTGLKDTFVEARLSTSSDNSTKLSRLSRRVMISNLTTLCSRTLYLSVLEIRCASRTQAWALVELLVSICLAWEAEVLWVVILATPCLLLTSRE